MNAHSMLARLLSVSVAILAFTSGVVQPTSPPLPFIQSKYGEPDQIKALAQYGQIPLSIEPVQPQPGETAKFIARSARYRLSFTSAEMALTIHKPPLSSVSSKRVFDNIVIPHRALDLNSGKAVEQRAELRMQLANANLQSEGEALEALPGKVNYFIGNDPAKWRTNVPTYAKIKYRDVYPGIDLVYYGDHQRLEYDFVVAPGADPNAILINFEGAEQIELNRTGDLVIGIAGGQVTMQKPSVYQADQEIRRPIDGDYVLKGDRQVGFHLGAYQKAKDLVIDPVLTYYTDFGGSEDEFGLGITVDAAGQAYVMGITRSTDFPLVNPAQGAYGGADSDVFVGKLNSDGSAFLYSTYLGGTGAENFATLASGGIDLDTNGNAYVVGSTDSVDFPVLNPLQPALNGESDAFVARLDAMGQLGFSSYLGGSGKDDAVRVAVGPNDEAYVTGHTNSTDFPTVNSLQPCASAAEGPGFFLFYGDAFVAKVNATGSGLSYATCLGGSGDDTGIGIAVDTGGYAYVTGLTTSVDFPTANPWQPTFGGAGSLHWFSDAFVAKLNPTGTGLVYSTYVGGSGEDAGGDVAVDAFGNAYVTGFTNSSDFPTANPRQPFAGGSGDFFSAGDAIVLKLSSDGSALIYSTYLGGSSDESGTAVAVDALGNAYVTGFTTSADFPIVNPLHSALVDRFDAFVTKLNSDGTAINYSTYLGGFNQLGVDIALDPNGDAYVTGVAADEGPANAFVAKIGSENGEGAPTPTGSNVSVEPCCDAIITFATVAAAGSTSITVSESGPVVPEGFSLSTSPSYYDISTTANYSPPVTVCLAYNPADFSDPSSLRLLHYEDSGWMDVTTSNDTDNSQVCGQVSSLSPFVVAQKLFTFNGFLPPVNNLPTLNVAKPGSAIPVKFSLGGNQGLNIFKAGYPVVKKIDCSTGAVQDTIEETVSAGNSGLSYEASMDRYIYVWKTDKAWAGTCRNLVLSFREGTRRTADFKFNK